LQYLGFEKLKDNIPDLLVFLQDMNWPAAYLISDLLGKFGEPVVPHVKLIFQTVDDDDIWFYWIIVSIISYWDKHLVFQLKNELVEIVKDPNKYDSSIEALHILKDILPQFDYENLYKILMKKFESNHYYKNELLDRL